MADRRDLKVPVCAGSDGLIRWKVVSGNGKTLARSPKGYQTQDQAVDRLALVIDSEGNPSYYKDKGGEWRWRFQVFIATDKGPALENVAVASEGYKNRGDCEHGARLVLDADLVEAVEI